MTWFEANTQGQFFKWRMNMRIENIHAIRVEFAIPVAPDKAVPRFVYVYLLAGDRLCLIDTGVAGTEKAISTVVKSIGKDLTDIEIIILTHSHPDHIGSASRVRQLSGAKVWAHMNERSWIEDIQLQCRERPVPGFDTLVSGSVKIDRLLEDRDILSIGLDSELTVLHTPGHSSGSISLLFEKEGILFSGDCVPLPGDMPIYEDAASLARSLVRLTEIQNLKALYSSWHEPLFGQGAIGAVDRGMAYLKTIHSVVKQVDSGLKSGDPMELCRQCVTRLGLPPFAANPLVARSLLSHKQEAAKDILE
jgi:glyoxylase-like metal-dependent hydrolase (beta-lactamase superfamily II)